MLKQSFCLIFRGGFTNKEFFFSAFYTAKYGYKVCLRIYLNGDGTGKGTHVSLFFVVMKGDYDALLPWPFRHKVRRAPFSSDPSINPLLPPVNSRELFLLTLVEVGVFSHFLL